MAAAESTDKEDTAVNAAVESLDFETVVHTPSRPQAWLASLAAAEALTVSLAAAAAPLTASLASTEALAASLAPAEALPVIALAFSRLN